MSDDLVTRLRTVNDVRLGYSNWEELAQLRIKAADEIERLRATKLELAEHLDTVGRVAADAVQRAEAAEAEVARLRDVVSALREAIEADYRCQGVNPRNVGDAHTWIALAMQQADEILGTPSVAQALKDKSNE